MWGGFAESIANHTEPSGDSLRLARQASADLRQQRLGAPKPVVNGPVVNCRMPLSVAGWWLVPWQAGGGQRQNGSRNGCQRVVQRLRERTKGNLVS